MLVDEALNTSLARIDVLVNNAGTGLLAEVLENLDERTQLFDVNIFG